MFQNQETQYWHNYCSCVPMGTSLQASIMEKKLPQF